MRLITGFKSKNIPRIMLTIPDKIKKNLLEPLIIILQSLVLLIYSMHESRGMSNCNDKTVFSQNSHVHPVDTVL